MTRALAVCSEAGCTELTPSGKCPVHRSRSARSHDRQRLTANQRGYNAAWRRTRNAYLADHQQCEATKHTPKCNGIAECVDHIDGLGPNGPRGHDDENLQALSNSCHSAKTVHSDGGGWQHTSA